MKYQFEQFQLDTEKLELTCEGEAVKVEPQVFALLELLVSNADRAVSKEEINERVWGGRVVSEAAVNSRIRSARQALNDSGKAQRLIRTLRDYGFRFVAEVVRPSITHSVSIIAQPPVQSQAFEQEQSGSKPAIAVLPLQLLSLDTRYEPLADAIAHEIIADLSRLRWLHVISRASTFKLRGDTALDDIASILGVDYVLSGTLALFGDKANVSIELTNTQTRAVVWAENFDSSLEELIELRVQLTTRITNAIEQRIQNEEADISELISTENLDAWMAYFRGVRHVHRFNAHDNEVASHLFQRAIELDSKFALAYAGLSFAEFQNAFVGYAKDIESSQQQALAMAEKAFELDQLDPVVNLTMGRAKYVAGEWEQAEPWFDRCTTLSPNNALAYYNKAMVHTISGDCEDVADLSNQALSLSPIDPLQYAFLAVQAMGHLSNGDYEQAAHFAELGANAPRAHHLIDLIAVACNYKAGNRSQAEYRRDRALSRSPDVTLDDYYRALPTQDERHRQVLEEAFAALNMLNK